MTPDIAAAQVASITAPGGVAVRRRAEGARGEGADGSVRVRRITCLKLDHVGDLLVAIPALLLLRRSFSDAHITLLCGPWNAGLALRLGVADDIRPIEYFAQNSSADISAADPGRRRWQAVREILALDLPPCDLAIDLRRDEDTRELLKLITARLYAGFGDLNTFSYLTVALPFTRHPPAAGATVLRLRPPDLTHGAMHVIDSSGLHLTARQASIDVLIATDAAWAPAEDGEDDFRLLGTALWRVDMEDPQPLGLEAAERRVRLAPVEIARNLMSFGPGWLEWESWGRWTNASTAGFRIDLSVAEADVRLLFRVQGHTSSSYPRAAVTVTAGASSAEHVFRAGDEPATLALDARATLSAPVARSLPYLMRGGRYRGNLRVEIADADAWEPLVLTIQGGLLKNVLARVVLPEACPGVGRLSFPFEAELKDTGEPVIYRIEPLRPDHHAAIGVMGLDMDWQQGRYPEMPLVHMEQQLLDLAAMVAQRYAPCLTMPEPNEASRLLSRARSGSTASDAVMRLKRRKRRSFGWAFGRPRNLVGVGVGANKATKLWPASDFIVLCRRILAEDRTDIVFVGGPAESALAGEIVRELAAGDRVFDMTASCRIEDLGELLAQLACYIGLDTGTTHFAGRIGLPTLAIFGASHDPDEWGPVGEKSDWCAADIACAGCSFSELSQCSIGVRCMTALTPDDIWPTVRRMIAAGRSA